MSVHVTQMSLWGWLAVDTNPGQTFTRILNKLMAQYIKQFLCLCKHRSSKLKCPRDLLLSWLFDLHDTLLPYGTKKNYKLRNKLSVQSIYLQHRVKCWVVRVINTHVQKQKPPCINKYSVNFCVLKWFLVYKYQCVLHNSALVCSSVLYNFTLFFLSVYTTQLLYYCFIQLNVFFIFFSHLFTTQPHSSQVLVTMYRTVNRG